MRRSRRLPLLEYVRDRYHPLWRLRKSPLFRWCQNRFDFPVGSRVGRVMRYAYFLRDFSRLMRNVEFEPESRQAVKFLLSEQGIDCFVDIGANIGDYSWWIANEFPHARLILFEPDERNIRLLRRSIARSALPGIAVHPLALSDRSGKARFIVDDASGSVGSLVDHRGDGYNMQASYRLATESVVETRRLDEFESEIAGGTVVVKIDVEGAEADVLRGARHIFETIAPVVVCESFTGEALSILRAGGYRTYALDKNANFLAVPPAQWRQASRLQLSEVS